MDQTLPKQPISSRNGPLTTLGPRDGGRVADFGQPMVKEARTVGIPYLPRRGAQGRPAPRPAVPADEEPGQWEGPGRGGAGRTGPAQHARSRPPLPLGPSAQPLVSLKALLQIAACPFKYTSIGSDTVLVFRACAQRCVGECVHLEVRSSSLLL